MTKRTSGRSMPIPNALVATIVAPAMKIFWVSSRTARRARRGTAGPAAAARTSPFPPGSPRTRCRYRRLRGRVLDRGLLVGGFVEGPYRQVNLRAVESADHLSGFAEAEPPDDFLADRGSGGRGERSDDRAVGQRADHVADPQVIGAEVMSPAAHAVCLVHREQPGRRLGKYVAHIVAGQLLRGEEDEARLAVPEQVVGCGAAAFRYVRVHRDRGQAVREQVVGLPLQREQRRHNHGGAAERDRGELVDRRIACTARHDGQAVTPRGQRGGGLVLPRPQLGIAEDVGGELPQVRCGGRGRAPYR